MCNNEPITLSLLLITTITTALQPIITGDKSGTNGVVMAVIGSNHVVITNYVVIDHGRNGSNGSNS